MFNSLFRMPPFKRGDVQQQTDDIRDFLTQLVRRLNEEEPEQAQQAETQKDEQTAGKGRAVQTVSGSESVPSGTAKALGSITLKKGTYIIEASVVWGANVNGYRILNCSTAEASTARSVHTSAVQTLSAAVTLPMTVVQCVKLIKDSTFYCNGYQNSGSALQTPWSLRATRID